MKFILLAILTMSGVVGGLYRGPFFPLCLYWLYGVLRPQFLWQWELVNYPNVSWSFYLALSIMGMYLPWVFGVVGRPNDPLRRVFPAFGWTHTFMLAFVVWMSLSYGFAMDQYVAWPFYWEFLKLALMYLLATQIIRSVSQVWTLYMVLSFALAYIALDVNHEYIRSGYLVLFKRGYAGLDNNGSGLMIAMAIPLLYFAWEMTKGRHRWFFLITIPAVIHAVVSSYSRGAMLSCIPPAFLLMLYSRKRKSLCIIYGIVLILIPIAAGKEIQERFLSVGEAETDESFNSRLDSWDAARKIANDYPIFGAGVRNSNLISKDYGADMEGRAIHSNYLQIAADTGWVGLLIYLGLFGTTMLSIWRCRRRLWKNRDPESMRMVAMLGGIECSLWTFAIGSSALSVETFELPYLLLLLGAQTWAIANASISPDPRFRPMISMPPGAMPNGAGVRPFPPPTPTRRPSPPQKAPSLPTRKDLSESWPRRPTGM